MPGGTVIKLVDNMTDLDQVIAAAFTSNGNKEEVNKVYLTLLRGLLYLPVSKDQPIDAEEPFAPLFIKADDHYFISVFDTLDRLTNWAGDQIDQMSYVEISGKDIISGLNDKVYLSLNVGEKYYKEFSPAEIVQLKKIVARIDQLKAQ
jgi:hypothetical protein